VPDFADPLSLALIALVGLMGGLLGGLLGVGGSVVMIPGLTLVLGYNQHLYQAAAMAANVAVAVPAAIRHRQGGAMHAPTLAWMAPAAVVCVLLGVWISNRPIFAGSDGGLWLGRLLAVSLIYVIYANIRRLRGPRPNPDPWAVDPPQPRLRRTGVGAGMGLPAGLLGTGGGTVAVPLQQVALKLPLRSAIANSSAIICLSAAIGAVYKNYSLPLHDHGAGDGLIVAGLLAPTALIGGKLGAGLTYKLPIRQVRLAFIGLMLVAAWKMAALPLPFGGP